MLSELFINHNRERRKSIKTDFYKGRQILVCNSSKKVDDIGHFTVRMMSSYCLNSFAECCSNSSSGEKQKTDHSLTCYLFASSDFCVEFSIIKIV